VPVPPQSGRRACRAVNARGALPGPSTPDTLPLRERGGMSITRPRPALAALQGFPSERFAFIDSLTVTGIVSTQVWATVGKRCVLDKAPGLRLIRTTYNGRDSRASPHCRRLCRVPCALRLTGTALALAVGWRA